MRVSWLLLLSMSWLGCAQGGGAGNKPDSGFDANLDLPDVGRDAPDVVPDASDDAYVEPLDGSMDDAGSDDGGSDPMDGGVDATVERCLGVDCSGMDGACVVGVCAPETGTCTTMPRADGTSCDTDAMDCATQACMAGVCTSTNAAECTTCATGVCSADGSCGAEPTTRFLEGFEGGTLPAGWTAGGSSGWVLTSGDRNSGTWSAQSGSIGNSQTSTLTTTIVAPVATGLGFHSRTSTESNYDWLEIWVDGTRIDRWSGTTGWTERVVALSAGSHTVEWRYAKDVSGTGGLDTVWIDDVRLRPAPSTSGTFDTALAPFTSSGTAWTRVTSGQRSGAGAARAGAIGNSATSAMSTSFTLSATYTISLWYNVSSEDGYDYFRILLDGTQVFEDSGVSGWTQWTRSVAAGSHTLELRYVKDINTTEGSDTVWVDDVDLNWPAPTSEGLCP
ncbi:MAG: hypothetical protein H6721_21490 [Sandaracinus sp.]|nr:hypothetical protein [Sandaracinus sp.]MCB9611929.1 hypothetical protein [Sandaracinus sp.]MCB9634709.1 hypothetical protein [Sandaracinus sp.]